MNEISVVIPTLNEAGNIAMLVNRITSSFEGSGITYEILFVDDNSTDGTEKEIAKFTKSHPVRIMQKVGERGKAYSLLQGFKNANYDTICMIDADLQYPPEAIVPMYQQMRSTGSDVVLTERIDNATSRLRKLSSSVFNLVFARLLFGFDYDTQSGLKLFKKSVINRIKLNPTPWSFDLEFIVRALEQNCKIISYQIPFAERYSGEAKVQVLKVTYELAKASLLLRFDTSAATVKRAYQTNAEFAEKALTTLAIVGAVMLGVSVAAVPVHTAALDLPKIEMELKAAPSLLQRLTDLLPAADQTPVAPGGNPSDGTNNGPAPTPVSGTPNDGAIVDPNVVPTSIPPLILPADAPPVIPSQTIAPPALINPPSGDHYSNPTLGTARGAGSSTGSSARPAQSEMLAVAPTRQPAAVQVASFNFPASTLGGNAPVRDITYPIKDVKAGAALYASGASGRYKNLVTPLLRAAGILLLLSLLTTATVAAINSFRNRQNSLRGSA